MSELHRTNYYNMAIDVEIREKSLLKIMIIVVS